MHGVGHPPEPALRLRDVHVHYGETHAVRNANVVVQPGELVALVGPNGAGKTSLLRAILGLTPYTGDVVVHGRSCGSGRRTSIAYVPQRSDVDLDFPMTLGQVVASGRRALRRSWQRPGRADRQAAARALSRVGLDGLEHRALTELSGGQVQRGFIARALAQEADVLLLDEPLTGVDALTTDALLELFARLAADGAALVVTTHDLPLVRGHFARCLALNGAIVADGAPAEVLAPTELERVFARA